MAKMCVRELRTEDPSVSVFYLALVSSIAAVVGVSLPASLVTPPPGMLLLGWVTPTWRSGAMLVGIGAAPARFYFWVWHPEFLLPVQAGPPSGALVRVRVLGRARRRDQLRLPDLHDQLAAPRQGRARVAMAYLSIVLTVAYGYFIFHEARADRAQATRLACSVLKARVQELRALP